MRWHRQLIAALVITVAAILTASAQDVRTERLHFKPGTSSTTVTASLKGAETLDYIVGAKAGQTMTVKMKTTNASGSFNVLPPGSEAAIAIGEIVGLNWTGTLPANGDYRIRVFLTRAAARRNAKTSYTLTVTITGSVDAKVGGTPYHATGDVPCSVGTDPKGSARCSFGVIRQGPGRAEVHLADPGFDVTRHKDHIRVLRFDGSAATSSDPKEHVKAEKHGDEWSVAVNDFYFYSIPDAVIVGG